MRACDDLVLVTMFQEAQFMSFDEAKCVVVVSFLKKFTIFKDILDKEKQRWLLILQSIFGHNVQLQFDFECIGTEQKKQVSLQDRSIKNSSFSQATHQGAGNKLDVSDATTWKLANELMRHFDGVITEISRDTYE